MAVKYMILISAFLIAGVFMNPLSSQSANPNEASSLAESKNGLEKLLEREAFLSLLKKKLGEVSDEQSSVEDSNNLDDDELYELTDDLVDNSDFDGRFLSKKSAPRRIFIGKCS
jgi:hypothetical protein